MTEPTPTRRSLLHGGLALGVTSAALLSVIVGVLGAFAALASYALFHLVTVFPLSWISLQSPRALDSVLWLQAAAAGFTGAWRAADFFTGTFFSADFFAGAFFAATGLRAGFLVGFLTGFFGAGGMVSLLS